MEAAIPDVADTVQEHIARQRYLVNKHIYGVADQI